MKVDQTDTTVRLAVAEIIRFKEEFEFIRNDSTIETDLSAFWLRKTKKPVLAVLVVQKPGHGPKLYRGTNMEVSMPTGSLCAERNVIGSALADDLTLRRQDLKVIAVYSVGSLEDETKRIRDRLIEEDGTGSGMGTRRGSYGSEGFISHANSSVDLCGADSASNSSSANQKHSGVPSSGTDRLPSPHLPPKSLEDSPVTQLSTSSITKCLSEGHLNHESSGKSYVSSQCVQPANKRLKKHIDVCVSASNDIIVTASNNNIHSDAVNKREGNADSSSSIRPVAPSLHDSDLWGHGTAATPTGSGSVPTFEGIPPLQMPLSDRSIPADVRRWVTSGKRSYSIDSGTNIERNDVCSETPHTESAGLGFRALDGVLGSEGDRLSSALNMLSRSPVGKKRDIMSIPITRQQSDSKGQEHRNESKSTLGKIINETQSTSDAAGSAVAKQSSTPGASK